MKVSDSASDDDLLTAASAFIIMLHASKNDRKEKKRRWWMTSLFQSRNRYRGSDLNCDLVKEPEYGLFENFCQVTTSDFELLVAKIGAKIMKQKFC